MASVHDDLKTVWQLRFRDSHRDPPETQNPIPKSEYTYAEAQDEAQWREQLYERGKFDPWVQAHPGDLVEEDHVTVGEAIERYVEDKTKAALPSGRA